MIDILNEAFDNVIRNRTRSIVGGLGVTWGILVLIILIGIGNGFKNAVLKNFDTYSRNSFWVQGGFVSKTHKQIAYQGTPVTFTKKMLENLRKEYQQIDAVSPEINISGMVARRNDIQNLILLKGIDSEYFQIKKLIPQNGRLINPIDVLNSSKVIIIGERVNDVFFKNEDCIGKILNLNGISYKIIGTTESDNVLNQSDINSIYIPYTTLMDYHTSSPDFSFFGLNLKISSADTLFENKMRANLALKYGFETSDNKALYIFNFEKQVQKFNALFEGIIAFLWFLAGLIIITGMFNISNLLFLIVKERSKDYAIRKAIGAKPSEILLMVVFESMFITLFAGLLGIGLGFSAIKIFNWVTFDILQTSSAVFSKAEIDLKTVVISFLLISICSIFVGVIPAKNASNVMPAQALKSD
jgi:putative ABC transport system permease protein